MKKRENHCPRKSRYYPSKCRAHNQAKPDSHCEIQLAYKCAGHSAEGNESSACSKEIVRHELRARLEQMDFAAFEQIMRSLLYRAGYLNVNFTGRKHKRGKKPQGGVDLTARLVSELSSQFTLVQVKQYRRTVSRRFVDELRGAMLRHGAEQGLLLTLSRFSKVAHEAARGCHLVPITLIEGERVLDLLLSYRLGAFCSNGTWCVDVPYLDKVRKNALGTHEAFALDTHEPYTLGTHEASTLGKHQDFASATGETSLRSDFGAGMSGEILTKGTHHNGRTDKQRIGNKNRETNSIENENKDRKEVT